MGAAAGSEEGTLRDSRPNHDSSYRCRRRSVCQDCHAIGSRVQGPHPGANMDGGGATFRAAASPLRAARVEQWGTAGSGAAYRALQGALAARAGQYSPTRGSQRTGAIARAHGREKQSRTMWTHSDPPSTGEQPAARTATSGSARAVCPVVVRFGWPWPGREGAGGRGGGTRAPSRGCRTDLASGNPPPLPPLPPGGRGEGPLEGWW